MGEDQKGRLKFLSALDALLSNAVVLGQHRACSNWTYPGLFCAMYGRSPLVAGFDPFRKVPESINKEIDSMDAVAELLRDAGYQTALLSTTQNLFEVSNHSDGFNTIEVQYDASAEKITFQALHMLDALDPDKPWQLHVHYRDPHAPYNPPDAYAPDASAFSFDEHDPRDTSNTAAALLMGQWSELSEAQQAAVIEATRAYDNGELRYMDAELEHLFSQPQQRGALDNTLVSIWSDHGEQFFEHGNFQHAPSLHPHENAALAAFWAAGLRPGAYLEPTIHQDIPLTVLLVLGIEPMPSETGAIVGEGAPDRYLLTSGMGKTTMVVGISRQGRSLQ